MKKIFLFCAAVVLFNSADAQLIKKLADKAKQKIDQRVNDKVDKKMDDELDGLEGKKSKTASDDGKVLAKATDNEEVTPATTVGLKAYSKYDFIQGDKVIAFDNFERAAIGDFPSTWNTNGSGEVVSLNTKEGKWLKINSSGFFHPEFINNLPDNCTLEFDLGVSPNYKWGSTNMNVNLTSFENKGHFSSTGYWKHDLHFEFHPLTGDGNTYGGVHFYTSGGETNLDNRGNIKKWDNKSNLFAHISFWRQGQRLRLYVNGDKILDLPRAFDANSKYTDVVFQNYDMNSDSEDFLLLGNLRLAIGAPDTRNKLISEGRFVTSGITFDVNSDKIKPESFGVLKEIAGALTDNPTVKVKIIGHTDSDGDAAKNLELSKKRAEAVKATLSSEFSIDASRMDTDGLGATKPLADNKTTEGKAQNRRVEFVKL
jgi:outer membrane protein OmpA-like peptidoglycan-associated protein